MIHPNPENTGRRSANVPVRGVARVGGYVTPGGQTVTPTGGTPPWEHGGPVDSLLQSLLGSSDGIASLFGLNQLGSFVGGVYEGGGVGGPTGAHVSGSDIAKALGSMFNLPPMGGFTGQFGSKKNDPGTLIANWAATQHQVGGDPSSGRIPGMSSHQDPDLSSPDQRNAAARALGAQILKQWIDYGLHGHDPNRSNPKEGGPHPDWVGDDETDSLAHKIATGIAVAGGMIGATVGAVVTKSPGGAALGAAAGTGVGLIGGAIFWASYAMTKEYIRENPSIRPDPPYHPPKGGGGGTPDPETGSGGGPRSFGEMPDPETGSGGGPRGFGYAAMPDPATGSGGGPRGDTGIPDPETGTGGGPRSFAG